MVAEKKYSWAHKEIRKNLRSLKMNWELKAELQGKFLSLDNIQALVLKLTRVNYIKIKNIWASKDTTNRLKKQP